jgi:hypothetical protein
VAGTPSTALSMFQASITVSVPHDFDLAIYTETAQYITWVVNSKASWTLTSDALGKDDEVQIGARAIPQEPMVSFDYYYSVDLSEYTY